MDGVSYARGGLVWVWGYWALRKAREGTVSRVLASGGLLYYHYY